MSSPLTPPSCSLAPRCPSPVIPGAWPISAATTPSHARHERSSTYPPSSRATSAPHLSIAPIRRHLSLSHSNFHEPSSNHLLGASSDVFTPAHSLLGSASSDRGSGLTMFTPHDTVNSLSYTADTSISTICTADSIPDYISIASDNAFKAEPESPFDFRDNNGNKGSVYTLKRLSATAAASSQVMAHDPAPSPILYPPTSRGNVGSFSRPERPRIIVPGGTMATGPLTPGPPQSRLLLDPIPISPIIFASPTSSVLVRSQPPCHDTSDDGWEKSLPSTSPLTSPPQTTLEESLDSPRMQEMSPSLMEDRSGGMNMLTSLSLPGTPVSIGTEAEAVAFERSWTQSPSLHSSTSQVSILSANRQSLHDEYGLANPSPFHPTLPTVSPLVSPSSSTMGPPSPTSELSSLHPSFAARLGRLTEEPEPMGAAEYAEAVMSIAWGSDSSDHMNGVAETGMVPSGGNCRGIDSETPRVEYVSKGTSTRGAMIEKIKRFGGKVRRFLRRSRDKNWRGLEIIKVTRSSTGATVDADVERSSNLPVGASAGITTIPPPLQRKSQDLTVRRRTRRPRPSLNEHTYTASAPLGGVPSHSASSTSSAAPRIITCPTAPVDNDRDQAKCSDPELCNISENTSALLTKTGRLSSSVVPAAGPSSQPALTRPRPLSSIISVDRHIPVMSNPRRTYCGPVTVEIEGLVPVIAPLQTNFSGERTAGPPGLPAPTTTPSAAQSGSLQNNSEMAQHPNRRFSLSSFTSRRDSFLAFTPFNTRRASWRGVGSRT